MSKPEYAALAALDAELFQAHLAEQARVTTVLLEEESGGWRCTVRPAVGFGRTQVLPTRSPIAAMRCVERAVGQGQLAWEERGDALFLRGLRRA
jgi:hypothetical protein